MKKLLLFCVISSSIAICSEKGKGNTGMVKSPKFHDVPTRDGRNVRSSRSSNTADNKLPKLNIRRVTQPKNK